MWILRNAKDHVALSRESLILPSIAATYGQYNEVDVKLLSIRNRELHYMVSWMCDKGIVQYEILIFDQYVVYDGVTHLEIGAK